MVLRVFFALVAVFAVIPDAHAAPLRVLAWDHNVSARKLAVAVGEKSAVIEHMHHGQRTEPINVPAGNPNVRLVDLEKRDDEGKPLGVAFLIPEAIKRPLLLLVPDEKSALGLKPLILDDNLAGFGWGSFNLLNATGKPLVAQFYDDKLVPLRASTRPVNYAPPRGSKATMSVKVFDAKNESKKAFYSDVWEYGENLRQLVILVPRTESDTRGPMELKFVVENRLDVEPQAP